MTSANLEHVNTTVSDPHKTAQMLCELFDWHIRWQGSSLNDGYTIHVGTKDFYVALYTPLNIEQSEIEKNLTLGGLNHIGVSVDNLDEVEQRVLSRGFRTHNHADYDPGRRFYFNDQDGIEYEVVEY